MNDPTKDPRFLRDPYPTYAAMRSVCPVQPGPTGSSGRGSYVVTGYTEAREALSDSRLSKDTAAFFADKGSRRRLHPAVAHNMLASDPPEHARLRKLVTKAFTTGAVAKLHPFISQVTDALLDQWSMRRPGRPDRRTRSAAAGHRDLRDAGSARDRSARCPGLVRRAVRHAAIPTSSMRPRTPWPST